MSSKVEETKATFNEKAMDLLDSNGHTIENAINIFVDFCESDKIMATITLSLKDNANVNISKWYDDFSRSVGSMIGSGKFILPTNDDDRLALLYQLLLKIKSKEIDLRGFCLDAFGARGTTQMAYQFNQAVSRPLTRGLLHKIEEKQSEEPYTPRPERATDVDPKKVWVVHGRNEKLRMDLFQFLRAIGLSPLEFSEAIKLTGETSPYIGQILDAAFKNAQAVIVLLSPDDEARLRGKFQTERDSTTEKELTPQPRQNVLFEAGLSFGFMPKRTILVKVGELRPFSDIYGRHEVRLANDSTKRQELVNRLIMAGCQVSTEGSDWLKVGNFDIDAFAQTSTQNELRVKHETGSPEKKQAGPDIVLNTKDLTLGGFPIGNLSTNYRVEFFNRGDLRGSLLDFSLRVLQASQLQISFSRQGQVQFPIQIDPKTFEGLDYQLSFSNKIPNAVPPTVKTILDVEVRFEVSTTSGREERSGGFKIVIP